MTTDSPYLDTDSSTVTQLPVAEPQDKTIEHGTTQLESQPAPLQATSVVQNQPVTTPSDQFSSTQPKSFTQPDKDHNTGRHSVSRKNKIAYFLVGFIFQFLALIPISLWMIFKTKENRKKKILYYFLGIFISLALMITVFVILIKLPPIQKDLPKLASSNPELAYIKEGLVQKYPNADYSISKQMIIYISKEEGERTYRKLTVSLVPNKKYKKFETDSTLLARDTCDLLEGRGERYDEVEIQQDEKRGSLLFSLPVHSIRKHSCDEWKKRTD